MQQQLHLHQHQHQQVAVVYQQDNTINSAQQLNNNNPNGPKPRGRRKKIRTEPIRPICPQCEKQFSNQSALTKHKLTHSDERKFACQQCSKAFKRHDHLTGHMQTHSNRKPFNCTIQGCDKTYCDARSLRRHKENIHHIVSPKDNNNNNSTSTNHQQAQQQQQQSKQQPTAAQQQQHYEQQQQRPASQQDQLQVFHQQQAPNNQSNSTSFLEPVSSSTNLVASSNQAPQTNSNHRDLFTRRLQRLNTDQGVYGEHNHPRLELIRRSTTDNQHYQQASFSADYATTAQHFPFPDLTTQNHSLTQSTFADQQHHNLHQLSNQQYISDTVPHSADSVTDSGLGLNVQYEQQQVNTPLSAPPIPLLPLSAPHQQHYQHHTTHHQNQHIQQHQAAPQQIDHNNNNLHQPLVHQYPTTPTGTHHNSSSGFLELTTDTTNLHLNEQVPPQPSQQHQMFEQQSTPTNNNSNPTFLEPVSSSTTNVIASASAPAPPQTNSNHRDLFTRRLQRLNTDQGVYGDHNHPRLELIRRSTDNQHYHQASFSADYATTSQHFPFPDLTTQNHSLTHSTITDQQHSHHNHHQQHHHQHQLSNQQYISDTVPHSADSVTDSGLGLNVQYEQQQVNTPLSAPPIPVLPLSAPHQQHYQHHIAHHQNQHIQQQQSLVHQYPVTPTIVHQLQELP